MAQAQAMQVMVRAYRLTKDIKYLDHAQALMAVFFISVDSGGVSHKQLPGTDGWWYEEYASPEGDDPMPLNGMMYTLVGLYEHYKYGSDPLSGELFRHGFRALIDRLPEYDRNGHSYYDRLGRPAGGDYHQVHIELLDSLYQITGEPILAEYRDRWSDYSNAPFVIRLWRAPTRIAPLVLMANIGLVFLLLEVLSFWFRVRVVIRLGRGKG